MNVRLFQLGDANGTQDRDPTGMAIRDQTEREAAMKLNPRKYCGFSLGRGLRLLRALRGGRHQNGGEAEMPDQRAG